MATIDLEKVNKKNVSKQSISKDRVPNTILDLDTQNSTKKHWKRNSRNLCRL